MATIATLAVSLVAKTGSFDKGLKKALRVAKEFDRDLTKHVGTIATYTSAVITAAAGISTYLVKGQLEAVDATSKLSRTLGIATEDLVTYEHAADLAGVNSDTLAKAIFRLNKSTDASFAGMSSSERVLAIADQYQKIGSAAARAEFLTKNFGKAGLELGAFFEQGSDGIRSMRKEAEDLGLVFSSAEGLGIENANDSITRLQKAISGVARTLAVQVAPYIEIATKRIVQFATSGKIGASFVEDGMRRIFSAAGQVADSFALMQSAWNVFASGLYTSSGLIVSALSNIKAFMTGELMPILGGERGALDAVADAFFKKADESAKALQGSWKQFTSSANQKAANDFFNGILKDVQAVKLDLVGIKPPSLEVDAQATKPAQFQQVDLQRIVVGGIQSRTNETVGEKKIVKQLEKSNNYLLQITKNNGVVVI